MVRLIIRALGGVAQDPASRCWVMGAHRMGLLSFLSDTMAAAAPSTTQLLTLLLLKEAAPPRQQVIYENWLLQPGDKRCTTDCRARYFDDE